jgi:hypothetical protein
MKKLMMVAGVLAIVAAACSSGDDATNPAPRPFEEIQDSALEFENDPTFPGRAIFRVTTTEAAICAIVWGETEDLGHFNNSLAMNGTGIVQHDVFLPEAEAGKTYFYRLQGSTANGTLYQSELMTFTLPEQEAGASDAVGSVNLAIDGTVTEVSSEFSTQWVAGNAFDNDLSTEWSSQGDGNDSFITVDIGSPQRVAGFEFLTRTMADGTATTTTYTVTVDGGDQFGPFDAGNPANPSPANVDIEGQVFRFNVTDSTGGNTGAIEVRILAP